VSGAKTQVGASSRRLGARGLSSRSIQTRISRGALIRLALKGEVIDSSKNSVTLLFTQQLDKTHLRTQTLQLTGKWKLTKSNQLRFKLSGSGRTLRFEGAWKLLGGELIYEHRLGFLKRGVVSFDTLKFRGKWVVRPRLRLHYEIIGTRDRLEFSGRIVRLSQEGSRGRIYYDLGVTYKKAIRKGVTSSLEIIGRWRPSKKGEIEFLISLLDQGTYRLRLRGTYQLNRRDRVEFSIGKQSSQRPELSLILARKLFGKNGEIYLKGVTDLKSKHFIGAGGTIKW
jgi:hypothetical protein